MLKMRAYAAPAAQGTGNTPPPRVFQADRQTVSCAALGSLRSASDGAPTNVTFVNDTDGFRAILWIDFDGVPQDYASLNPGESYTQPTFVGHPWMIADGPGNCLEIHMPTPGDSVFEITAPNRDFGAE